MPVVSLYKSRCLFYVHNKQRLFYIHCNDFDNGYSVVYADKNVILKHNTCEFLECNLLENIIFF